MPWQTIIPGDGDNRLPGEIASRDERVEKKPLLRALFDMLERIGRPRYNPSGNRDRTMMEEDDVRRRKVACLLELLNNVAFPPSQRKSVIKRLRELMSTCAFSGIGYLELIQKLENEQKAQIEGAEREPSETR